MTSQLVEKAESREKERQREETKKQKKLDSAFKALHKNAAPPLDVNSVWEEVQIRTKNVLVFARFSRQSRVVPGCQFGLANSVADFEWRFGHRVP